MFFSTKIKNFGLDISDRSLKLAHINRESGKLRLASYNQVELPVGILENGEIKDEKKLIHYIKKIVDTTQPKIGYNHVVACLPEVKTFIKLINIKCKDKNFKCPKEKMEKLIRNELPAHIPFDVEDVHFDWQIIKQEKENFHVLIGVAPKKTIEDFSRLLEKCDLIPVALEIEAQAIIRASFPKDLSNEFHIFDFKKIMKKLPLTKKENATKKTEVWKTEKIQSDDNTVYFVIDCGASRSGLIIWDNGTIKLTSSLQTCGIDLTELISEKLKINFKEAEKIKKIYGLNSSPGKNNLNDILQEPLEEMCNLILKVKDFYTTHLSNDKNKNYEIILTGGSSCLTGLDKMLTDRLGMNVSFANPLINLDNEKINLKERDALSYTTAIGLALRQFLLHEI